jgi:tripartite-type tricarboxylate transporter receptor subunit TctC
VDVVGRIIAERLSARWKQPVIVDNRPGAGTVIGTDAVAKAPPDGHTILFAVTAHAVNATLVRKLPYDTQKDFAPIVLAATAPNILAVNPNLPVRNVAELIAYARANPGKLNAGSHGKGNTSHLAAEMPSRWPTSISPWCTTRALPGHGFGDAPCSTPAR